jgi:hypothetical protein
MLIAPRHANTPSSNSGTSSTHSRSRTSSHSGPPSTISSPALHPMYDSDCIILSDEDDVKSSKNSRKYGQPSKIRHTPDLDTKPPKTTWRAASYRHARSLSSDIEIFSEPEDVKPLTLSTARSRKRALSHAVIDISSDAEGNKPSHPSTTPALKSKGKLREAKRAKRSHRKSDGIKITSKLLVDSIEILDAIPSTWAVPRNAVVYALDLSQIRNTLSASGNVVSLDAFIRSEVSRCRDVHIMVWN